MNISMEQNIESRNRSMFILPTDFYQRCNSVKKGRLFQQIFLVKLNIIFKRLINISCHIKINWKWIINIKPETLKFLEENIERKFLWHGLNKDVSENYTKNIIHEKLIEKLINLGLITIKNFCLQKKTFIRE